jgi:hypothetical protein
MKYNLVVSKSDHFIHKFSVEEGGETISAPDSNFAVFADPPVCVSIACVDLGIRGQPFSLRCLFESEYRCRYISNCSKQARIAKCPLTCSVTRRIARQSPV